MLPVTLSLSLSLSLSTYIYIYIYIYILPVTLNFFISHPKSVYFLMKQVKHHNCLIYYTKSS